MDIKIDISQGAQDYLGKLLKNHDVEGVSVRILSLSLEQNMLKLACLTASQVKKKPMTKLFSSSSLRFT